LLLSSVEADGGVGDDETHGKYPMRRTRTVVVINNCEKKERDPVVIDGVIRYKSELIDDEP
jgi:hypothetical protein